MRTLLYKLLCSGLLLGFFLWRIPLSQVWLHLSDLGAATLFCVTGLAFAAWLLSALRLWCLIPELSLGKVTKNTFISLFYSTVLPGQITGDVVKAYRLGKSSVQRGHAEAATLVDRALALFALCGIGAAASFLTPASATSKALLLPFLAAAAMMFIVGSFAANHRFRHQLLDRFLPPSTGRIREFLRHFGVALHECMRKPWRLAVNLLLALLFHVLCIVAHVVLGWGLQIELPWVAWAIVYSVISLVTLLPISIAGVGLREGGYVGILALFGIASDVSLSLSFTVFAISLLGAACGGLLELAGMPSKANNQPDAEAPP